MILLVSDFFLFRISKKTSRDYAFKKVNCDDLEIHHEPCITLNSMNLDKEIRNMIQSDENKIVISSYIVKTHCSLYKERTVRLQGEEEAREDDDNAISIRTPYRPFHCFTAHSTLTM